MINEIYDKKRELKFKNKFQLIEFVEMLERPFIIMGGKAYRGEDGIYLQEEINMIYFVYDSKKEKN